MATQKFKVTEEMLDQRIALLEAQHAMYDRIAIAQGRTTKAQVDAEQAKRSLNTPPPAPDVVGETIRLDDGEPFIIEGYDKAGDLIVSRTTSDETERRRKHHQS